MSTFELTYNSKSRSANVEIAKRMLKDLVDCEIKDDGQYYKIIGSSITKKVVELYLLVSQWKGSELKIDKITINDHWYLRSIVECSRLPFCNGDCKNLGKWQSIFYIISGQEEMIENEINEKIFNIDEHEDILIETDEKYFVINTKYLKSDFIGYCQLYLDICPKFNKNHYDNRFSKLEEVIKVRRISFNDIVEKREETSESELLQNFDLIITRIGDEFEKRMRLVLEEYKNSIKKT